MVDRLLAIDALPVEIRLIEVRRAAQHMHQLLQQRCWMMAAEADQIINETEEPDIAAGSAHGRGAGAGAGDRVHVVARYADPVAHAARH